jgi:phage terminase large subunit-like protein
MPQNDQADRTVGFINGLTHTKGQWARQPFNLRTWQESIVRRLFGTVRPDGLRQYRTAFISFPRKQGKTELASAIALYLLMAEAEAGGQVYSAATDREQAGLVFHVAAAMIRNDPDLSAVCRIVDSHKKITYVPTDSTYRALAADADHHHGYDASCVVADEVHAWKDRALWDVLKTSMGARRQPLMLAITTAGYDRHSLCWELYDYACKVKDGVILDPAFLPVIYEAPADADWTDEAVWHAANPALGDFRSLDEMRQSFREAREIPAKEMVFRRLYLNQWTESAARWIPLDVWDRCAEPFDLEILDGRPCTAGLDLAYRDDVAALVLLFQLDDAYFLLPRFWLPEEGRRDLTRPPFDSWVRSGLIETTPGNSTDFGAIRRTINDLSRSFQILKLAVDPWNGRQLSIELIDDGFEVEEFAQTLRNFNEPTKTFEALVKAGRVRHAGNPVLRWMASNVCIESDASGNYRPSKKKSSEKIDGIVAALMALALTHHADVRYADDGLPDIAWIEVPGWR